jgi:hypothetical protein
MIISYFLSRLFRFPIPRLAIVTLVALACCSPAICDEIHDAAKAGRTWLEYSLSGGLSPESSIMTIDGDGSVTVQISETAPLEYKRVLTADELKKLKDLVLSTHFFDLDQAKERFVLDVGETRLSIRLAGKVRELKFRRISELAPLPGMLGQLLHQARLFGQTPFVVAVDNFPSSLPKTHKTAILGFYLKWVREYADQEKDFSSNERNALLGIRSHLADARYAPAIPYFAELIEKYDLMTTDVRCGYLGRMGLEGVKLATQFLKSSRKETRIAAIETIGIGARANPHSGFWNPLSAGQYDRIKSLYNQATLPLLSKMAKDDPDERVRVAAASAAREVRLQMAK